MNDELLSKIYKLEELDVKMDELLSDLRKVIVKIRDLSNNVVALEEVPVEMIPKWAKEADKALFEIYRLTV